jgi:N utilization substance protein A
VAVAALQDGIDPVGCCVGLRGIRIQNIVSQLNGERIDAVQWDADPAVFVANALSPASVLSVELDEDENVATVVVPDRQLSLAIGKEGRNARLAAKLTGWRIDLKSSLVEEPGKVAPQEEAPVGGEIVEAKAESPALEVPAEVAAPQAGHEELLPLQVEESQEEAPQPEEAEPIAIADIVLPSLSYPDETSGQPRIRFAEDILIPRGPGRDAGGKKKGKRKKKH